MSKHGKANLILSGGTSTIGVYKMLSNQKLPWEKVFVYLLDERIVSKKNINSNYGSLKKIFSKNSKIKIVDLSEIYKKKKMISRVKKNKIDLFNLKNEKDLYDVEKSFDRFLKKLFKNRSQHFYEKKMHMWKLKKY